MDRDLYKANMQKTLKAYPNLDLIEASVQDLLLDEPSNLILASSSTSSKTQIRGVVTEHNGLKGELTSHAVVITTGTFLRGGTYNGPTLIIQYIYIYIYIVYPLSTETPIDYKVYWHQSERIRPRHKPCGFSFYWNYRMMDIMDG